MVKRIIWPFNVGDWERDTAHLTDMQELVYFRLCRHYWSAGCLPEDERAIQRVAGIRDNRSWSRIKPTVQAFFHSGWQHKRIDEDIAKAAAYSAKQVDNAKIGQAQRARHSEHTSGVRHWRGKTQANTTERGQPPLSHRSAFLLPSSNRSISQYPLTAAREKGTDNENKKAEKKGSAELSKKPFSAAEWLKAKPDPSWRLTAYELFKPAPPGALDIDIQADKFSDYNAGRIAVSDEWHNLWQKWCRQAVNYARREL